jgi:hypothetical protein
VAFDLSARAPVLLLIAAIAATGAWAATAKAVTPVSGCASLGNQAEAQDYFAELGGSPHRAVGDLDGDHDGIACEGLPGPYKPFATIGYNRKGGFFYGIASMPPAAGGGEGFPCLYGNRNFPDAPRRLNVYRVLPGPDKPLFGVLAAEARPESGRLLWKAEREVVAAGRYYAAFEEKIRLRPYGANECPGFRSGEIALPQAVMAPVVS